MVSRIRMTQRIVLQATMALIRLTCQRPRCLVQRRLRLLQRDPVGHCIIPRSLWSGFRMRIVTNSYQSRPVLRVSGAAMHSLAHLV